MNNYRQWVCCLRYLVFKQKSYVMNLTVYWVLWTLLCHIQTTSLVLEILYLIDSSYLQTNYTCWCSVQVSIYILLAVGYNISPLIIISSRSSCLKHLYKRPKMRASYKNIPIYACEKWHHSFYPKVWFNQKHKNIQSQ